MGLLLPCCGQIEMVFMLLQVLEMTFKPLGVVRAGLHAIFISCASIHLQRRCGQIGFLDFFFIVFFFISIVSANFCNGFDMRIGVFVGFGWLLQCYCI